MRLSASSTCTWLYYASIAAQCVRQTALVLPRPPTCAPSTRTRRMASTSRLSSLEAGSQRKRQDSGTTQTPKHNLICLKPQTSQQGLSTRRKGHRHPEKSVHVRGRNIFYHWQLFGGPGGHLKNKWKRRAVPLWFVRLPPYKTAGNQECASDSPKISLGEEGMILSYVQGLRYFFTTG